MTNDLFNRLLILRTKGIGPVKYHELIKDAGGPEAAVRMLNVSGELIDAVKREMEMAHGLGIKYITGDMPEFPKHYRALPNHAPILSVRGNVETLNKKTIGIVGTRHATAAGIKFTSELANVFANQNIAVVSGMAMGTDAAAHHGALRANGNSQTIAGLAGGADYIWPLENERLYYEIVERGAVVSEMPVGFRPVRQNFVVRNRIVAGLSEQLILGEADAKSGSVITAEMALSMEKKLWAIPSHPSDERSLGPNRFIKSGQAEIVMDLDQFSDIKIVKKSPEKIPESDILNFIGSAPVTETVLTSLAKKTISEISSELIRLELSGLIRKTAGGYIRA